MKIESGKLPVMTTHCKSCPFRPVGKHGRWKDVRLANEVIQRTLFKGHQICHATEGPKREPRFRCKGAFDHNMVIYERMGFKDLVK